MAPIKTNNPYASYFDFFSRSGTDAVNAAPTPAPPPPGLTATGGIISDYTSGSDVYRAHIFTSSGALLVTDLGSIASTVEYLVVAGGGGGGNSGAAGGGGAGGLRTNVPGVQNAGGSPLTGATFSVTAGPTSYPIQVGGGGARGVNGGPSVFGPITSQGGGSGDPPAGTGGSGGGGKLGNNGVAGNTPPVSPSQGFGGGNGAGGGQGAGGGGGAGAAGSNASGANGGAGGAGAQVLIAEAPTVPAPTRTIGANGGYFAGGGGGGGNPNATAGSGGVGGGAAGTGNNTAATTAIYSTGGGGGGGGSYSGVADGVSSSGAPGIVVVRYQIAASQTGTQTATGGVISYYGGKTIHAFTSTGTFTSPGSFSKTCDYVVIGGGGGAFTGGGGAGGYRTGTTPIGNSVNYTITVGAGGADKSPIGGTSSIGTIPISVPGGGSPIGPSGPSSNPGASGGGGNQGGGGGGGGPATGAPYPGSIGATPAAGWGHAGGNATPGDKSGGGGGGAGSAGDPGSQGGAGIQLPTAFRDPNGFKYDNNPDHPFRPSASAGWFVAGGGAGTVYTPGPTPYSATYPGMGWCWWWWV